MCEKQLPPSRLRRFWQFINRTGWVGWIISLIILCIAVANYRIVSRTDRPLVRAGVPRLKATADPDTYALEVPFGNSGKADATGLKLTAGSISPATRAAKPLAPSITFAKRRVDEVNAPPAQFTIRKRDFLNVLVVCIDYTDELEPDVNFYSVLNWPPSLSNDVIPEKVSASEQETLSAWFSCAQIEK